MVAFESLAVPVASGRLASAWRRLRAFLATYRDSALAVFTAAVLPFLAITGLAGAMALTYTAELSPDMAPALRPPLLLLGGLLALAWLGVVFGFVIGAMLLFLAVGLLISPFTVALSPLFDPTVAAAPDFSWPGHLGGALIGALILIPVGLLLLRYVLTALQKTLGKKDAAWAVRFWRSVGGLVFGPPAVRADRLDDERRLVSRIAELGGIVTTPDLMGVFFWTPAEAESEVMRVMLDYGGDVAVTDDDVVLWVFPSFRPTLRQIEGLDATASPTRAELVPPRPLALPVTDSPPLPEPARFFGCTRKFVAIAMLLFVPAFVGPAIPPFLVAFPAPGEMWQWHGPPPGDEALQNFGAWPAALFLGAIVSRVPLHLRRRRATASARRRAELVRGIAMHPEGLEMTLSSADTPIHAELDASVTDRAGGRSLVAFPWAARALAAAQEVREGRRSLAEF
jgi:hypothetical protein